MCSSKTKSYFIFCIFEAVKKENSIMKKLTHYLVIVVAVALISTSASAQEIKENRASKQLTKGVNLAPKLQKATPVSVVQTQNSNAVGVTKPPKETKPIKVSKHSNNKAKRDDE